MLVFQLVAGIGRCWTLWEKVEAEHGEQNPWRSDQVFAAWPTRNANSFYHRALVPWNLPSSSVSPATMDKTFWNQESEWIFPRLNCSGKVINMQTWYQKIGVIGVILRILLEVGGVEKVWRQSNTENPQKYVSIAQWVILDRVQEIRMMIKIPFGRAGNTCYSVKQPEVIPNAHVR